MNTHPTPQYPIGRERMIAYHTQQEIDHHNTRLAALLTGAAFTALAAFGYLGAHKAVEAFGDYFTEDNSAPTLAKEYIPAPLPPSPTPAR